MKDFLGKELQIGDKVVYTSYEGSSLSVGEVTGFTPKMIRIGNTLKPDGYVAKVEP
jgi:hypothetical protein